MEQYFQPNQISHEETEEQINLTPLPKPRNPFDRPEIDYFKHPESDVVVNHVTTRFRKGLGTNIFVIGLPGTGKSSTCQRLGELITLELHGHIRIKKENIVDNIVDTLKFVKDVEKKGEVLIIEEVSVLFPSRRAMSKENVAIGKVFDTIRKKQIILITNAPLLKHIDSHMLALGHIMIETQKIVKSKQIVVSRTLRMQTNPQSGKTYWHRFLRNGRDVNKIYTRRPNTEVWDEYEESKDAFMNELYQTLKEETEAKLNKGKGRKEPQLRRTTFSGQVGEVFRLYYKERKRQRQIADILHMDSDSVSKALSFIKGKLAKYAVTKEELNGTINQTENAEEEPNINI